jgi:hypothetical protein
MNLNELEQFLNTPEFKSKVEKLFPEKLRNNIDFDFAISVNETINKNVEVTTFDASYDCDGTGIPHMVAVVDMSNLNSITEPVLSQFKATIELEQLTS